MFLNCNYAYASSSVSNSFSLLSGLASCNYDTSAFLTSGSFTGGTNTGYFVGSYSNGRLLNSNVKWYSSGSSYSGIADNNYSYSYGDTSYYTVLKYDNDYYYYYNPITNYYSSSDTYYYSESYDTYVFTNDTYNCYVTNNYTYISYYIEDIASAASCYYKATEYPLIHLQLN